MHLLQYLYKLFIVVHVSSGLFNNINTTFDLNNVLVNAEIN